MVATVDRVNNVSKSAVVKGTATPGAFVWVGMASTPVDADGKWELTVEGLKAGPNTLHVVQKIDGEEHDSKDLEVTIVDGGTVVPKQNGPIELERGGTTDVPFSVENKEARSDMKGTVELDAPAGTTFADGQTDVAAEVRTGDTGSWTPNTALDLKNGTLSDGGKKLTFDVDSGATELPAGQEYRYTVKVDTPADAAAGTGELGFVYAGDSSKGDYRAEGTTSTTVKAENGGVTTDALGFDVAMEVGETKDLFLGLEAADSLTSLKDTTFEVTAPAGTKFVQGSSKSQYLDGNDQWQTDGNSTATVTVKDGGAKAVVTLNTKDGWARGAGQKARWSLPIEGTAAGTGDATFTVSGTSNLGGFTASGKAGVTVTKPAGISKQFSVETPADNTTTANRSPYFMGWGTADSTVKVTDGQGGPVIGETTVDGNGWWGKVSTAELKDGVHTFVITQTKPGGTTETITRTVTIDSIRDLTIEQPVNGSTAWWPNPSLIGWGTPGATVNVTDEQGNTLGTETINADGWFGANSTKALANGKHTLTFTQTANGATNSVSVDLTIAHKPFRIEAPADGGSSWWPNPSYIGWATPGAAIDVLDTDGSTVLARTTANDEGWFGIVSQQALSLGEHTLHFRQTFNNATTETTTKYTIGADPLRIEAPTEGYTNWWPKPSFIGWATPGAKVRIEDTDGTTITTVTANGEGWFGEISPKDLSVGEHTLKFVQVLNDQDVDEHTVHITITAN
ncbi:Ig-like domain-containing protein [Curtobacterium sp. MCBD17_023]|uniref:Ig-like domain-containing protein n=1 Tax=Curtobacterium sp. MCBD17_023 TaxID=2175657 RepID=UPI000D9B93E6|nr:Ig-like domain-containing protein [Curtobacterium sp. MCBD17_023]PYY48283.1 hypothetical protein DEI84_09855 [Curtobacterium sp. MCBD17_023]